MRGYLLFHKYKDVQGYAVDKYGYDPFVWHNPYLWSFCRLNMMAGKSIQRRDHPSDLVILWLTRVDNHSSFCCSLVFYIADKKPLSVAKAQYPLAQRHFQEGEKEHYHYYHAVPEHFCLIADMNRSYLPKPAVPIEDLVDSERQHRCDPTKWKPLRKSWGKRTQWICFDPIDTLVDYVCTNAQSKHFGAF